MTEPKPKRKWWDKCTRMKLRVWLAILLIAVPALFCVVRKTYYTCKLRAVESRLRAKGIPLTAGELWAWYPKKHLPLRQPGDALDTASGLLTGQLQGSSAASVELPNGDSYSIEHGEAIRPDVLNLLRQHAKANAACYAALDKALAGTSTREYGGFDDMANIPLPFLAQYRMNAKQQALRALEAATRGDNAECVQAIENIFALSHRIAREPTMIHQLVRFIVFRMTFDALEQTLFRASLTDAQLRRLRQQVASAIPEVSFPEYWFGEIVMLRQDLHKSSFPYLIAGVSPDPAKRYSLVIADAVYRLTGCHEADACYLFASLERLYAEHRLPLRERTRLKFEYCRAEEIVRINWPFIAMYSRLTLPAYDRMNFNDLRTIIRLQAARVAIAVERYRLAHGRIPQTLDELVPEYIDAIPEDPYAGKPLKYLPEGDSYRVYSIGVNQIDDGGADEKIYHDGYNMYFKDHVFTVERAPPGAEKAANAADATEEEQTDIQTEENR